MSTEKQASDKRQLPRLLCDERFSDCQLLFKNTDVSARSINFNRLGIGIFAIDRLPDETSCQIDFSYDGGNEIYSITQLPCTLMYIHETEVGSQCGIRFELAGAKEETLEKLIKIEEILTSRENSDDRYGIFDP